MGAKDSDDSGVLGSLFASVRQALGEESRRCPQYFSRSSDGDIRDTTAAATAAAASTTKKADTDIVEQSNLSDAAATSTATTATTADATVAQCTDSESSTDADVGIVRAGGLFVKGNRPGRRRVSATTASGARGDGLQDAHGRALHREIEVGDLVCTTACSCREGDSPILCHTRT